MKPVVFLSSARSDLRSEKNHYREIEPELARRLQMAVGAAVDGISRQPRLMEAKAFDIRRWPIGDGFPHGILYREHELEIIVLSIFHPKRNPEISRVRARS